MSKISVIIPVYNCENYIDKTILSVLSSTFQDIEIILINDGSTDNSLNKCFEWAAKDDRIKIINQPNSGVISARNAGIRLASSEYIYPLDGDDKIHSSCLEKLHAIIETGQYDVVYSQTEMFDEKTGILDVPLPTPEQMIQKNVVVCSALYKKADWEKYGGYDNAYAKAYEDWGFWLCFIEEGKRFYRIDETLFFYRIKNVSRNHTIAKADRKAVSQYIKTKHKKLYDKYYLKIKIINKLNKLIHFFMRFAAFFVNEGLKHKLLNLKLPYRLK